jgi:nucleoside-diphosphate-sugar epimerase
LSGSNLSLLRSAKAHGSTLKTISVTGSINALTTGSPDELKANVLSNDFWSDITQEQAREANNAYISYCSGKKEAELAIWKFVKDESPSFTVTVFLPALIFGPPIQPVRSIKGLNYSSNAFYELWNGSYTSVPPTTFPSYIDVRDLAYAQVQSLTVPEAADKRYLIGGTKLTYSLVIDTLRKLSESKSPELKGRLPEPSDEAANVTFARIEAVEGNKAVGLEGKIRSVEETFGDAAKRILELEKKFSKA